MATPYRNIFDAFIDDCDPIQTQDSDVEPADFESDDNYDPYWDSDQEISDANLDGPVLVPTRGLVECEDDLDNHQGPSRKRSRMAPDEPDSDDSEGQLEENGWRRSTRGYPSMPAFTANPGLSLPTASELTTPIHFVKLIFTHDVFKLFKTETNRYAATEIERVGVNAKPHSIHRKWKPVTMTDIRGVFAILIHMSLVDKPRISDYWTTNPILTSPFASQIMSRDRFCAIMAFFHLSDNSTYIPRDQPGHQPLHKIQSFYNHLQRTFSSLYTPLQKVSIDEAICPWRGHLRFRVYMKDKPNKWGIKLYELCESSSGYVCSFEIYAGDPMINNRPVDVCLRMMTPYFNKGYILYTDNYYTCPVLANALKENGTMSVGTVRHNRVGMPKGLAAGTFHKGQVDYRVNDGICAIRWMDKKNVNLLTTIHDPNASEVVRTRTAERVKPSAIQDYTLNMAGVDRSDQMIAYMPLRRRTMKWWKKLFMHLFTLCLVQPKILFTKKTGRNICIEDFLVILGKEIADDYFVHKAELQRKHNSSSPVSTPVPAPIPSSRLVAKHSHFPQPIPPTSTKDKPYRACKVCYQKEVKERKGTKKTGYKRQETRYWCPECKVALCVNPCFEDFHTKKQYV